MIYVGTKQEIETKRQGVHPQMAPEVQAVADSLEEAGDKLTPMEIDPHVECDRAIARRVQAAAQDPDRAAFRDAAMLFWES